MKNIVLSAVAVLAMSSFAVAGGDIAPIEEPIVEEVVVAPVSVGGFYIGLGYGILNTTNDVTGNYTPWGHSEVSLWDDSYGEIMFQAGYKFNQYVAIEGRYWYGVDKGSWLNTGGTSGVIGAEVGDLSFDAYGLYVKPMYPIGENFEVYALLGYGSIDSTLDGDNNWEDGTTADGFSWGIGVEYEFSDGIAVFVDYTSIYSDTLTETYTAYDRVEMDIDASTINFGVSYMF